MKWPELNGRKFQLFLLPTIKNCDFYSGFNVGIKNKIDILSINKNVFIIIRETAQ